MMPNPDGENPSGQAKSGYMRWVKVATFTSDA